MKLEFKKMGDGPGSLIILHGLFGSSDNWQTLGRQFSENHEVILADLRNHGHSPWSHEMNYDVMADDVAEMMDDLGIDSATLVGHSMGGKTVMRFAQLFPDRVEKMVVVDIGVRSYRAHHDDVLDAFKAVNLKKLESRKEAEAIVEPILPDFGTRQFLLKNLYRTREGGYQWRSNYKVLEANMENILASIPERPSVEVPALFIVGAKSGYVTPGDFTEIQNIFPQANFEILPTGHWIHAEDPDSVYTLIENFVTL